MIFRIFFYALYKIEHDITYKQQIKAKICFRQIYKYIIAKSCNFNIKQAHRKYSYQNIFKLGVIDLVQSNQILTYQSIAIHLFSLCFQAFKICRK